MYEFNSTLKDKVRFLYFIEYKLYRKKMGYLEEKITKISFMSQHER